MPLSASSYDPSRLIADMTASLFNQESPKKINHERLEDFEEEHKCWIIALLGQTEKAGKVAHGCN